MTPEETAAQDKGMDLVYTLIGEDGLRLVQSDEPVCKKPVYSFCTRSIDILSALTLLTLLSPLLLLIALLIKAESRGPVFFRQDRLGFRGKTFRIFKFRTMVDRAWEKGTGLFITAEDSRITRVGKVLRVLHLDEIPQLLNVIVGDMSLVGPRPAIPYHAEYYEPWEWKRLEVAPGITGYSQINGANRIDWDIRIILDVWYAHKRSIWMDTIILFRTAAKLILSPFLPDDSHTVSGPVWKRGRPDSIDPVDNQE